MAPGAHATRLAKLPSARDTQRPSVLLTVQLDGRPVIGVQPTGSTDRRQFRRADGAISGHDFGGSYAACRTEGCRPRHLRGLRRAPRGRSLDNLLPRLLGRARGNSRLPLGRVGAGNAALFESRWMFRGRVTCMVLVLCMVFRPRTFLLREASPGPEALCRSPTACIEVGTGKLIGFHGLRLRRGSGAVAQGTCGRCATGYAFPAPRCQMPRAESSSRGSQTTHSSAILSFSKRRKEAPTTVMLRPVAGTSMNEPLWVPWLCQ